MNGRFLCWNQVGILCSNSYLECESDRVRTETVCLFVCFVLVGWELGLEKTLVTVIM